MNKAEEVMEKVPAFILIRGCNDRWLIDTNIRHEDGTQNGEHIYAILSGLLHQMEQAKGSADKIPTSRGWGRETN